MLVCGVEEPIQENGFLLEANEHWRLGEADYELASFTDPRLYRYSFVHLSDDFGDGYYPEQSSADFSHVLQAICDEWKMPLTAIWRGNYFPSGTGAAYWARSEAEQRARAEYSAQKGDLSARRRLERPTMTASELAELGKRGETASQARLHDLRNAGWNTYYDDELLFADKPISSLDYQYNAFSGKLFDLFPPIGVPSFFVIGVAPSIEAFAQPALRLTMRQSGEFTPGPSVLSWLAEQPFSLVYLAKDTADHPGLVIVGTRRIDARVLLAKGIVRRIEADYGHAWQYPPDTSKLFP